MSFVKGLFFSRAYSKAKRDEHTNKVIQVENENDALEDELQGWHATVACQEALMKKVKEDEAATDERYRHVSHDTLRRLLAVPGNKEYLLSECQCTEDKMDYLCSILKERGFNLHD